MPEMRHFWPFLGSPAAKTLPEQDFSLFKTANIAITAVLF
jgi:hypothetical protein